MKKPVKKTAIVNVANKFKNAEVHDTDKKNTLVESSPSVLECIDENPKNKRKKSSSSSTALQQQRRVSSEFSVNTDDLRSRSGFTLNGKKGSAMSLVEARVKNPTVCFFF